MKKINEYYKDMVEWSNENKIKSVLLFFFIIFIVWFFTREVQDELPYKLSGSEVLEVKEKCKQLAESTESEWRESKWRDVLKFEIIDSGFSERGGFCYMEYFDYFDDWTAKKLYNTTNKKDILTRRWPDDESLYQRGFNMVIKGQRRFYQTTY